MLQEVGLSEVAEAIYWAMLEDPKLGIAELSDRLELPERLIRAGLDELVRATLLRESREKPDRFRAVNPEVGLASLVRRQEQELVQRQRRLLAQRAALTEAVAQYTSRRSEQDGGAERLIGIDAIQTRLEELAHDLAEECLAVMPGGAQSKASLENSRPLDAAAMARGITLLTLYQDSVRSDAATHAYAQWMTENGGQVRTAPLLPPRMLVFDRTVAVIPIDPANTRYGAVCTTEAAIVASLVAIFELAWNTAVPLGANPKEKAASDGLTATDKELLRLLATGMTDEAAGHRLGLSARTVRRQMAALMEQLGATSRFEAGLKAAQRGWL